MKRRMCGRAALALVLVLAGLSLCGCGEEIQDNPPTNEGYVLADPMQDVRLGDEGQIEENRAKYDELTETALLMVVSGGYGADEYGECIGSSGYAIMENGDVYKVGFVSHESAYEDKDHGYASIVTTLRSEDLDRVKRYVKDARILLDAHEDDLVLDAWSSVYANEAGKHVEVKNDFDLTKATIAEIKDILGIAQA